MAATVHALARVRRTKPVEAVASEGGIEGMAAPELGEVIKRQASRWFVMRNARTGLALLPSRTTLCWLRGPMARDDVRRLARSSG